MDSFMRKCTVDRKIVELLILETSFNSISKQKKVGKKRIRQVNNQAEKFGYLSGTPLPPYPQAIFDYPEEESDGPVSEADQALLKHKEWIIDRVEAGWHLITIWEELPFEAATEVSRSSFFRFIRRHKLKADGNIVRRVIPEIVDAPGESLQLDWGKLCDIIDPVTKKKKTIWFLVGVMGFSRYMMTRLVWGNSTDETLKVISSMLSEMGGSPMKITSDNPKCFATEASKFEAILNPAFERFCGHFGIIAELLPPRDPQKKGKVEKAVPYVRRLYEAHGEWTSIEEAQRYMDRKMVVANERKHGTTRLRPIEVFLENEITALSALPPLEYSVEEYNSATVRKDGCARFRNKYYSVGEEHIGSEVFIIGGAKIVEIFFKGKLLETHTRVSSSHQAKSIKKHHLKPHERIMQDNDYLLTKAAKIGEDVKEMVEVILLRGRGYVDTRSIWGILSLDKDHGKDQVNQACKYALECDRLGYQGVMRFINMMPKEKELIDKSSKNKFVRDPKEYEVTIH